MTHNKAPTKAERERLRGEGDKIKFIEFRFEKYKLWESGEEGGKVCNMLHVLGRIGDLYDRIRGLGSEIWSGCELVEM